MHTLIYFSYISHSCTLINLKSLSSSFSLACCKHSKITFVPSFRLVKQSLKYAILQPVIILKLTLFCTTFLNIFCIFLTVAPSSTCIFGGQFPLDLLQWNRTWSPVSFVQLYMASIIFQYVIEQFNMELTYLQVCGTAVA